MLGQVIANTYRIEAEIGKGGMGAVFRGVDINLDRPVAIKVIKSELAENPEILQRFSKEAKVLARLNHSNIATLYSFVRDGNSYYMVMEFAPGQTLRNLLADSVGGLPWRHAVDLFLDALRAIDYAHSHDIIHRDIKPRNMMVSERGTLKVLDFGIARVLGESGMTKAGIVIGTTKYMSPEQVMGKSIDARSDIYALGTVLYEMLTGHTPFQGLGEFELMKAQVEQRPTPVGQMISDLPEALDNAVSRALEKDPKDRFQSASEFIQALVPLQRDEGTNWKSRRNGQGLVVDENLARQADMSTSASRIGLGAQPHTPPASPPEPPTPPRPTPRPRLEVVPMPDATTAAQGHIDTSVTDDSSVSSRVPAPSEARPIQADDVFSTKDDDTATDARIVSEPQKPVVAPPVDRTSFTTATRFGRARRNTLPKKFGKYTILTDMDAGRNGPLYEAYDRFHRRHVVLKVISTDSRAATRERDRFIRAAGVWSNLDHHNVVRVYDLGFEMNLAFIALELLEGTDLRHIIQHRKGYALTDKLKIMLQVCEGLHHIHQHGIFHRDIRPNNIFVSPNLIVKVLDSRLSREAEPRKEELTVVGEVLGDLRYIAPEQAQGNPGYSSDIYSAGALFCDLLTYQIPASYDPRERLEALRSIGASIPQGLRDLITRTLSPNPLERPPDFRDMAIRIAEVERGLVTSDAHNQGSRPDPTPPPLGSKVVFTLHGIRTHAGWQRTFSEVATVSHWQCRLDRWNYGYFSVIRFLLPWQRRARVVWFQRTYNVEINDRKLHLDEKNRPCIIAHSFGTYILGNALLTYDWLLFDKIILCGSILPTNFPWHELIERGQVQAVRNEFGRSDKWTRIVSWFVRGAGPSGIDGFSCAHKRLEQTEFPYAHSTYFEEGHMTNHWIPFLNSTIPHLPKKQVSLNVGRSNTPWALYLVYGIVLGLAVFFLAKSGWAS